MHTKRACCGWCLSLATAAMVLLACATRTQAQQQTPDGAWTLLPEHTPIAKALPEWIRPGRGQALAADLDRLKVILSTAPLEFAQQGQPALMLQIPDPDGVLRTFRVEESPIMEPGLAAQFPDIHTYVGQGVDDRTQTLRADVTMFGFHAQVLDPEGDWYIDPYSRFNTTEYTSYYRTSLKRPADGWTCNGVVVDPQAQVQAGPSPFTPRFTNGTQLRTLRLACAATGEYTAFFGGTVALGQASIVTAINRVTGVYEKDLAVRLTLVANNSLLVYTNSATDPYTNGSGGTMLGQNQTNINSVIGSANYDIGHVFSTGGGGVAGLGVICGGSKANGVTGSGTPTGDPFWIDYVAHEMGHQFGGNHDFNSTTGSCSGNRTAGSAYEIGSGSTIMPYAGICGADDLQAHSDAYFHYISINEILNKLAAVPACGTSTATGNTIPVITVPATTSPVTTIPIGTPFALTASATDANGDALTYCWEEFDLGVATTLAAADNGTSPIIRSFNPSTSGTRFFPRLALILSGGTDNAEKRPAVTRSSFKFQCTVRDNRANGGGVASGLVTIATTAASGPFLITAPGVGTVSASNPLTVTWNVAGTTAAPVSCANVKISLSTDGGNTFPTVLLASTPNNGSAMVTVPPSTSTTTARIKVESIGNFFFDISHANFTITPGTNPAAFAASGSPTISDNVGNGNNNAMPDPGETQVRLTIPISNTGGTNATSVTGVLTSNTGTVLVGSGSSGYPNLAVAAVGSNSSFFVINVNPSHPCGTPINLSLAVSVGASLISTIPVTLTTGQITGGSSVTVSYVTASPTGIAIPDNTPAGVDIGLPVSGVGTISDLNFKFGGASCSATAPSTTVGLDHTYVGDLIVKLTSPAGTTVTLINRIGVPATTFGNDGDNFCQTVLDDDGVFGPIQSVTNANSPFTNSYLPNSPLSAFDGQNANGTWVLNVSDNAGSDTGNVWAFSLIFNTTAPSIVCSPPFVATGACCLPAGGCTPITQTECQSVMVSGAYQGDNVSCTIPANPCQQPTGACCEGSTGSCTTKTSTECASLGRTYQGNGVSCTIPANPCPQPTGACCIAASGDCTSQTSAGCAALAPVPGTYQGDNTSCNPNPCPQPPGACCNANGVCFFLLHADCPGQWFGPPFTCAVPPCPQPTGACCNPDSGVCTPGLTTAACDDLLGDYHGNNTTCTPNPCPQPTGACCDLATGFCGSGQTAAQCALPLIYQGNTTTCAPNPCPQPTGACCIASTGACNPGLTSAQCASLPGNYQGNNTVCAPNPCPQPTGACCAPNGVCTPLTSAQCASAGNAYQGNATNCVPNPCVPVTYLVSITRSGSGSGTVTSVPAGISCGSTCAASFIVGTNVTLSAVPNSKSEFVGWSSGPCSGTGACNTSVTGPLSINAVFHCRADFNNDGVANVADIFAYLSAWFTTNLIADFNGDHVVNVADIFAYLSAWFGGC